MGIAIVSIVALCTGLIVGTLVGYYIASTSTSVRLMAISTMKETLPTLDRSIRISWENTAYDLAALQQRMLDDTDIFAALAIDESELMAALNQLGILRPRTNAEDVAGLLQYLTKVELAYLAIDFARKAENLHRSQHTYYAN